MSPASKAPELCTPASLPENPSDLLAPFPGFATVSKGLISLLGQAGLWQHPMRAYGDLERMRLIDKLYWLYKATRPIERARRDSGLDVEPLAPGVDEISDEPDPAARAHALAARKADAVWAKVPDAVVIGADQVVTDGVEIWGKPENRADHVARLSSMRGRSHDLVTGWAIRGPAIHLGGHERTRLWARADA